MDARPNPWVLRTERCLLEGYSAVDPTSGEIAWASTCDSARCPRCSRIVSARSFALARQAITGCQAHREGRGCEFCETGVPDRVRYITLTLAPEEWQDLRERMKRLAEYLRRRGVRLNWLWVVEEGSATGMRHIHAVQWGDFIPWQDLLGWWGSRVEIKAGQRAATGYLSKNVVRYLGKGLDGDREAIEAHMNLNGGRAAHWSRGFFGGVGRDEFARRHPLPGIYLLRHELLED